MAGTTGFISKVTLLVREADEDISVLGAFRDLDDLLGALEDIKTQELALWHVGFRNPLHVKLSREAVEKQAKRDLRPGRVKDPRLPEDKVLATFVYPGERHRQVADRLCSIIEAHTGEVLDGQSTRFEWGERFYPRRLKALGPSLLQSDTTISTEKLAILGKNINHQTGGAIITGHLTNHGEKTAISTYVLGDEREQDFGRAIQTIHIPLEETKKLGGNAYALGMYFTDEAERLLGKDRLVNIYKFKKQVDPDQIMNPGKVFLLFLTKNRQSEPTTK